LIIDVVVFVVVVVVVIVVVVVVGDAFQMPKAPSFQIGSG